MRFRRQPPPPPPSEASVAVHIQHAISAARVALYQGDVEAADAALDRAYSWSEAIETSRQSPADAAAVWASLMHGTR
jgi:hypothetical protein